MISSPRVRARFPRWVVAGVVFAACSKAAPPPKASAIPISSATAMRADVPLMLDAIGTVEPIRTVAVQAQIGGLLTHVGFKEGQDVQAGQVLFEIDARPYQAAVQQSQATLSRDLAQLQIAKRDVDRIEALAAKEYATQQQLDQARTNAAALTATLRADSAGVERAQLDLQYATIRAPISGLTGSILVREGNVVRATSEPLVVINQISPVLVRFAVPAQYLDVVSRRASQSLAVRATPANVADTSAVQTGTLIFLDNAVDSLTSTLTLKASFPNAGRVLWPGALVRVTLQLDTEHGVVVVPRTAVQSGQAGDMVWVIDSASKVTVHKVTVARNTDSLAIIATGVNVGDQVVTDGQLRLTDGAKVKLRGSEPAADSTAAAAGAASPARGATKGASKAKGAGRGKPS
jgi:multidrug efflux system membrane fusion protein